jgi:hypothetical protein
MAIYRQIYTTFWQDEFVLSLTPEEKYFYLYLITNSKTTMCGIYEITIKIMEFETGYNRETVEKLIEKFEIYKKIIYSRASKEMCIINWAKYNINRSPKVQTALNSGLQAVKDKTLIPYLYPMHTISSVTVTETVTETGTVTVTGDKISLKEISNFFNTIWNLYPKKLGKGSISASKKKEIYKIGLDEITRTIDRYKNQIISEKIEAQFIKHGSTFFNSGYIDYLDCNFVEVEKPKTTSYDIETIEKRFRQLDDD